MRSKQSIPYGMFLKAGMSKTGELHHLKAPSGPALKRDTDMRAIVLEDPRVWTEAEELFKLRRGLIRVVYSNGFLPVMLKDADGAVRGFTMFSRTLLRLYCLVIYTAEELLSFLSLLQDGKAPEANVEWMHLWIDRGEEYLKLVLSTIPGAVICEQHDYLEGSTSD